MKLRSSRALIGAGLLGAAIALIAWHYFTSQAEEELIADCFQFGLDGELQALSNRGDCAGAVRRMEEACDSFHTAKARLGGRYRVPDGPAANGTSYLYTTLVGLHSDCDWYMANLPRKLADYFCLSSDDSNGPPKQWERLASEMRTSRTPVLRTIGTWLLDDREAFATEIYAQVDGGDSSYKRLEYIASYRDPLLHRGFPRLVAYSKSNGLANEESHYHRQASYIFHQLGPKALATGMVSDEDLRYARDFALKYRYQLGSYASPASPESKWESEFRRGSFLQDE